MMRLSAEEIGRRTQALADTLRAQAPRLEVGTVEGASVIGGGAAPGATLPTVLLAITCQDLSADELAARLRAHQAPIVARVEQGKVLLDLRTVFPEQDAIIADALSQCR
jgi:L-seryl-tRNA(Ser) seleniumtransferase